MKFTHLTWKVQPIKKIHLERKMTCQIRPLPTNPLLSCCLSRERLMTMSLEATVKERDDRSGRWLEHIPVIFFLFIFSSIAPLPHKTLCYKLSDPIMVKNLIGVPPENIQPVIARSSNSCSSLKINFRIRNRAKKTQKI